jgi:hypothetical protein
MGMDQRLTGLFDELEKLGVNKALSHFTQGRGGRRPIRVNKLLEKEQTFVKKEPDEDETDGAHEDVKDHEVEAGLGMSEGMEG